MSEPEIDPRIEQELRDLEHNAYDAGYEAGFLAGLKEYAWWKDGEEQVGSCGTTLKEAIERYKKEGSVVSPKPTFNNDI